MTNVTAHEPELEWARGVAGNVLSCSEMRAAGQAGIAAYRDEDGAIPPPDQDEFVTER